MVKIDNYWVPSSQVNSSVELSGSSANPHNSGGIKNPPIGSRRPPSLPAIPHSSSNLQIQKEKKNGKLVMVKIDIYRVPSNPITSSIGVQWKLCNSRNSSGIKNSPRGRRRPPPLPANPHHSSNPHHPSNPHCVEKTHRNKLWKITKIVCVITSRFSNNVGKHVLSGPAT